MAEEVNMETVAVTEEKEQGLSDLQIYGINATVVRLLSKVRKYTILTQVHMNLSNKPQQIQPMMREIYQFEETKMIMDIREEFDMFYVYTRDKFVIRNAEMLREKFEQSITFVTTNMQTVNSVLDKNFNEILDTFTDQLQVLSANIASKSIFDEHFKIG
jgi:hypothetical protein